MLCEGDDGRECIGLLGGVFKLVAEDVLQAQVSEGTCLVGLERHDIDGLIEVVRFLVEAFAGEDGERQFLLLTDVPCGSSVGIGTPLDDGSTDAMDGVAVGGIAEALATTLVAGTRGSSTAVVVAGVDTQPSGFIDVLGSPEVNLSVAE